MPRSSVTSVRAAIAALILSTAVVVGCGSASDLDTDFSSDDTDFSSDDSDVSSDDSDLDLDPSQTFPEEQRDRTYDESNGSDAEEYCRQINTPDMNACQEGYNNLDEILND